MRSHKVWSQKLLISPLKQHQQICSHLLTFSNFQLSELKYDLAIGFAISKYEF